MRERRILDLLLGIHEVESRGKIKEIKSFVVSIRTLILAVSYEVLF